jgi:hypothetical protein
MPELAHRCIVFGRAGEFFLLRRVDVVATPDPAGGAPAIAVAGTTIGWKHPPAAPSNGGRRQAA